MKRHKYSLQILPKKYNKNNELKNTAFAYLSHYKTTPQALRNNVLLNTKINFFPISKIHTFCLVTGRVRYTITLAGISRHIFFDYSREGFLPGFFSSS